LVGNEDAAPVPQCELTAWRGRARKSEPGISSRPNPVRPYGARGVQIERDAVHRKAKLVELIEARSSFQLEPSSGWIPSESQTVEQGSSIVKEVAVELFREPLQALMVWSGYRDGAADANN
jgi:hypothetical protein